MPIGRGEEGHGLIMLPLPLLCLPCLPAPSAPPSPAPWVLPPQSPGPRSPGKRGTPSPSPETRTPGAGTPPPAYQCRIGTRPPYFRLCRFCPPGRSSPGTPPYDVTSQNFLYEKSSGIYATMVAIVRRWPRYVEAIDGRMAQEVEVLHGAMHHSDQGGPNIVWHPGGGVDRNWQSPALCGLANEST
jgi:hypothetical protein